MDWATGRLVWPARDPMMTAALLRAATGCTEANAERFAEHLGAACARYSIVGQLRAAAFLAQIGHESGSLRYVREIASGEAYEGRRGLGNTQPGDGPRYRGRGLIQVTGRSNYRQMGELLRSSDAPDFEDFPEALEEPRWAAYSAAAWWHSRGLNELADSGQFDAITQRINGGQNGAEDRRARWARAKAALAAQTDPGATLPTPPMPAHPARPAAPPAAPIPAGETGDAPETPMVAPLILGALQFGGSLIGALAQTLVAGFAPLAQEKIAKELGRHTGSPQVAEQVATAMIETVKAATGKADPIEAVAAARSDPEVMQRAEDSALGTLDQLAPLLEKIAQWDQQAWAAEEASRDAASVRARSEEYDMTPILLIGAFVVLGLLILLVGGIVIAQVAKTDSPDTATWSALTGLIGWATGTGTVIYAYRFGTTRSSAAKDVVIGELSRRSKV